jgi:DNA/RNA endonuclease YhcR with UshA esterase domain
MFKYGLGAVALAGVAVAALSQPSVSVNGKVGENATVEGVVDEVHVARGSGATFLDMGGAYPSNTFTAVIWSEDAGKFPGITALEGQKVTISGPLQLYRGKEEIILRSADQLKTD